MQIFRQAVPALIAAVLAPFTGAPAAAQTDFYNLDKERPLRVEDAYSTKRWAFEVQLSPLTLSQDRSGGLSYQPALELKHGFLPGMEVSVGTGWNSYRMAGASESRLSDVDLSALANLWVEGSWLPAAALRVTSHLPTESEGAASLEVKGILTRSIFGPVRLHVNGAAVMGEHRTEDWWAGAALDYVLPFQHTLLMVDSWVASPAEGERQVHSTAGLRYQLGSTVNLDAGVGRSWTGAVGDDWALTLGVTHEFGVRSLMPGGVR